MNSQHKLAVSDEDDDIDDTLVFTWLFPYAHIDIWRSWENLIIV